MATVSSKHVYCLRCKRHTDTSDLKTDTIRGRSMLKGKCKVCAGNKSRFIKADETLTSTYYDIERGYSGVNQLAAKTGVSRSKVQTFLDTQNLYTKFRPARVKFQRRQVVTHGIDDQWQADLVEMIHELKANKGFRYILTCIDTFSKFAWAIPVKRKTSENVVDAFKQIIEDPPNRIPKSIQTDDGKEFFNSKVKHYFSSLGIHHFSTRSEIKACMVERFNRTLKEKLEKIFHERGTRNWIDVIDGVLKNYNTTVHRTTKLTPTDGSKPSNTKTVLSNIYKTFHEKSPKFKEGEAVRIRKYKGVFTKGYKQTFTNEVFLVSKVFRDISGLYYYHITDLKGEHVEGTFYAEDLCRFTGGHAHY